MKARDPSGRVVGCQPEKSRVMAESVRAGRIVELDSEPTLADGTAGGLDPDAITFPISQRSIDQFVLCNRTTFSWRKHRFRQKQSAKGRYPPCVLERVKYEPGSHAV